MPMLPRPYSRARLLLNETLEEQRKKYLLLKDERGIDQTFTLFGTYHHALTMEGLSELTLVVKVHGKRRFERAFHAGIQDITKSVAFLQKLYGELGDFLAYFLEKYPDILFVNLDIELQNIIGTEPYRTLAHTLAERFKGIAKFHLRHAQREYRVYFPQVRVRHSQTLMTRKEDSPSV